MGIPVSDVNSVAVRPGLLGGRARRLDQGQVDEVALGGAAAEEGELVRLLFSPEWEGAARQG